MFDIGGVELLMVAVVAILFVRPKDLPVMLRTIGQYVGRIRAMAREFQRQFEEAARDTGVDDIKRGITSMQDLSPTNKVKEAFNSIGDEVDSVKSDVDSSLNEAGPVPKAKDEKAAQERTAAGKATETSKAATDG